jgi:hypothetical protein
MEGFDSGYGFAYRRQKINSDLPYLVANEPSLYLRNTDGYNNYELRLDASGLVIYNNDVSFIAIDVSNPFPVSEKQHALLYTDKKYEFTECISTKGKSPTELRDYTIRSYGDAFYFSSKTIPSQIPVDVSNLYLTPEGNLVATNDPMTWANGMKVLDNLTMDISNGQFITDGTGNYFEYIRRDNVFVFEHYKLQKSPWELILTNTFDIPSSFTPGIKLHTDNQISVSNETIYISDKGHEWKWANGYDVSNTLTSGGELHVNGWMCDGDTRIQLKNDGLYLNGTQHIQFKSKFATSMKLEDGDLIVRDNNEKTIWNLNTGPGKATKLKVSDDTDENTLYLTNDVVKWTIYPDASYNYSDTDITDEYATQQSKLKDIRTKHSGSDERYSDTVSTYYREMINTFNLGVGLIVGTIVIFKGTGV